MLYDFAAMTDEELMGFWSEYNRPSRRDAEFLVGDKRKGYTSISASLANFACNLAVAHACAKRGDADATRCYQLACVISLRGVPNDVLARVNIPAEVKSLLDG